MKKGIIAIIVILVIVVVAYLAYMKIGEKPLIANGEFGHETMKSMKVGQYNIACNDAKSLVIMLDDINKDFSDHPELANEAGDNMTPSMKSFETSMDNLGKAIESKFAGDNATKDKAFSDIGEGVAKIFQVAVYKHLGMVSEDNFSQFIDITFCGATPKEGYKSPIDLGAMQPVDNSSVDGMSEGIDSAPESDMGKTPAAKDAPTEKQDNMKKEAPAKQESKPAPAK